MALSIAPPLDMLDGWSLRPLGPGDDAALARLHAAGGRHVIDIPPSGAAAALMQRVRAEPYGLAAVVERDGDVRLAAATALGSLSHLTAYVLVLAEPLPGLEMALALCLRALFWHHPVVRVFTHVPDVEDTVPLRTLLAGAGFVDEGTMVDHAVVDGRREDVRSLGLLREEAGAAWGRLDPRLPL